MKRSRTTKRELKFLSELVAFDYSPIDRMSIKHFLGKEWGGHAWTLLRYLEKKGWVKLNKIGKWHITKVYLTNNHRFFNGIEKKYTCLSEILFKQRSPNRWDGTNILYKKECDECPAYRKIDDEERCYAGVAWKRLCKPNKLISCQSYKTLEDKLPDKAS